jgi:hypothetical protein
MTNPYSKFSAADHPPPGTLDGFLTKNCGSEKNIIGQVSGHITQDGPKDC